MFIGKRKMINPKKKSDTAVGFDVELGGLSRLRVALKTDRKLDKALVVLAVRPLDVLIEEIGVLHADIAGPEKGLSSLKKRAGGLVRKRDNGFESDIGMLPNFGRPYASIPLFQEPMRTKRLLLSMNSPMRS